MNAPWVLFWIASITLFLQSLDTTILSIAIPAIADSFSLLFMVLGMGLLICCFIFIHLSEDDGRQFIHGR